MMRRILGTDNDQVRLHCAYHLVKIHESRALYTHIRLGEGKPAWIDIAESYEFKQVRVLLHQPFLPKRSPAHTGTYQHHTEFPLHVHTCLRHANGCDSSEHPQCIKTIIS